MTRRRSKRAAHFGAVMEHIKSRPCIVTGRRGVDAAHLSALVRRGESGPAVLRGLDRAGTSHNGWRGLIAAPLAPELHRSGPESQHELGYDAWLERHGLTDAEVAWGVARMLAEYVAGLE